MSFDGDFSTVRDSIRAFLDERPKTAQIVKAARAVQARAQEFDLKPFRLAVLPSFTLDQIDPHLVLSRFTSGYALETAYWSYNQWHDALANEGTLDRFAADAVFVLQHLEDVAPNIAARHLLDPDLAASEADVVLAGLSDAIDRFRERSGTPVILATFIAAASGVERCFDGMDANGKQAVIDRLNAGIRDIAEARTSVYVLDYAAIVADAGRRHWFDRVKSNLTMAALRPTALADLAQELDRFLNALAGPRQKVLALDLDNTLWGGVVGEDGVDGIALGGDYPGNAFLAFQSFVANLRASGVLLAAVSKNNVEDAKEVFDSRPDLPLRWEDFSSHQVNWQDKATNLKAVAAELNLGLNAIVFADDNPMECDLVGTHLPDITIVHLDGPPDNFPSRILSTGAFDTVRLTEEDTRRAGSYRSEKEREALRGESVDTSDFLRTLGLRLRIGPAEERDLERVAQLFGKTNQFNLTTRRHDQTAISAFRNDPNAEIVTARLADRFGDYGLIGVGVLVADGAGRCTIDSFLMSCRVLGRNVEESMMTYFDHRARALGADELVGLYQPTQKNRMVEDLYPRLGLHPGAKDGEFILDLRNSAPRTYPEHVDIETTESRTT